MSLRSSGGGMRCGTPFFTASAREAGGYSAAVALAKYASVKSHKPAHGSDPARVDSEGQGQDQCHGSD